MIWTAEAEQRLRQLVNEDNPTTKIPYSAAEIGAQIGIGRNAVIGKCHRMGLTLRGPRGTGARDPIVLAARRARREAREAAKLAARNGRGMKRLPWAGGPDFAAPNMCKVQLLDLECNHCRFPVGEVGSEGFFFCGSDIYMQSYCHFHFEITHGYTKEYRTNVVKPSRLRIGALS